MLNITCRQTIFLNSRKIPFDFRQVQAYLFRDSGKGAVAMVTAATIGSKLESVRKRMNWTLSYVSEKTGLAQSALSEFENGKRSPKVAQLKQLADVYRRDIGFFLIEGTLPNETVLWRQEPTGDHASEVKCRLICLAESYHNLEAINGEPLPPQLYQHPGKAFAFSYRSAEALASKARSLYKLCDKPGWVLLQTLEEELKVKVFHLDLQPTGCAACTLNETYGAAILLNANHVRWRRNFDLAHEFFHLMTWKMFRSLQEGVDVRATKEEESFADCFAANLLMPSDPLKEAVSELLGERTKLTSEDVREIARLFDVSAQAAAFRIASVYRVEKEAKDRFVKEVAATSDSWNRYKGEDPPLLPHRYQVLAKKAHRRGLISTGRYAEYMGISRAEAAKEPIGNLEEDAEIEIGDA
jgi:Zn-dependent peptidase ImmA (M78 family)/transcriptional regulator with XRE-family HTH domain